MLEKYDPQEQPSSIKAHIGTTDGKHCTNFNLLSNLIFSEQQSAGFTYVTSVTVVIFPLSSSSVHDVQ